MSTGVQTLDRAVLVLDAVARERAVLAGRPGRGDRTHPADRPPARRRAGASRPPRPRRRWSLPVGRAAGRVGRPRHARPRARRRRPPGARAARRPTRGRARSSTCARAIGGCASRSMSARAGCATRCRSVRSCRWRRARAARSSSRGRRTRPILRSMPGVLAEVRTPRVGRERGRAGGRGRQCERTGAGRRRRGTSPPSASADPIDRMGAAPGPAPGGARARRRRGALGTRSGPGERETAKAAAVTAR